MLDIPGLSEAIAAENGSRDEAWLNLPDDICGIEVSQMTPFHLLLLEGAGNCFVTGSPVTPEGVAQFLWILSPDFCLDAKKRNNFIRKVGQVPYQQTVRDIGSFIATTFQDAPASSGFGNERPLASFVAYYVYIFASDFGWKPEDIVKMPLRQIYQLLDIRNSKFPNYVKIRPSDKVIADWLKEQNKQS